MRVIFLLACSIGMLISTHSSGLDRYVVPLQNNTGVFKNEIRTLYEEPLFFITTNNHLLVEKESSQKLFVRNAQGVAGWVDKTVVTEAPVSKSFNFDTARVYGYMPFYQPLIVHGKDQQPSELIEITRTFEKELKENVDRETTERIILTSN